MHFSLEDLGVLHDGQSLLMAVKPPVWIIEMGICSAELHVVQSGVWHSWSLAVDPPVWIPGMEFSFAELNVLRDDGQSSLIAVNPP